MSSRLQFSAQKYTTSVKYKSERNEIKHGVKNLHIQTSVPRKLTGQEKKLVNDRQVPK